MQTFLPYKSYSTSARALDRARLGKQRLEARMILEINLGLRESRWSTHPAVKMWRGYEADLAVYGWWMCEEWIRRGYTDGQKSFFSSVEKEVGPVPFMKPSFITDELILSHRSNLLRKMPEHYRRLWPDIPDDLPYYWPKEETV